MLHFYFAIAWLVLPALISLACTAASTNGLTIPVIDRAERAARATLAKWSLEDAKLRRQSIDIEDLFIAHIGGLDVLAKALINASNVIEDKFLESFKDERYQAWNTEESQDILSGKFSLKEIVENINEPKIKSGKQELLEKYISNNT